MATLLVSQTTAFQPSAVRAADPSAGPSASASAAPSSPPTPRGATAPLLPAGQLIIVPYQATGYQYQVVAHGGGAGFEATAFDDSSWSTGTAAFGSGGPCPLESTVATAWAPNTDVLVRSHIALPAGWTGLTVGVAVDNDVQVYWNGTLISSNSHDNCPTLDSFGLTVADALLVPGINVLAVRGIDRGDQSLLDLQVRGTPPAGLVSQQAPAGMVHVEHNVTSNDPVGTFSGDFRYSHTDVAIPGRGPAPTFTRSYDGAETRSGALGPGWTDNYATRLRDPADGSSDVLFVGADGNTDIYTHNPDDSGVDPVPWTP